MEKPLHDAGMKNTPKPRAGLTMGGFTKIRAPTQVAGGWQLQPASGRIAGAVVLGIITVFWNGFVWLVLRQMWTDFTWGAIFGTLFLSIFALLGLLLAGLFVHTLLKALFTPRPTLELASDTIDPARTTQVRWSLSGKRPLADLRISLVLREECQYRRGTDTLTDRHEVRELVLFERPEPAHEGTLSLTIPADLPPSFASKNNQLLWCLRLRGSVPKLPDVDDEFPLVVRPATLATASIFATPLPSGSVLPDDTPALALAGQATAGNAVAGVVHVPGRDVHLRLRWSTSGKGDSHSELLCDTLISGGVSAFFLTLPSLPPAWSGTVLSITWQLEAVVENEVIAVLPISSTAPVDAAS